MKKQESDSSGGLGKAVSRRGLQVGQMVDFAGKDFKTALTSMFRELKETVFK